MNRSVALTAVPSGVAIVMGPDPVAAGVVVPNDVVVTDDTVPRVALTLTRSFGAVVSKFVPVTLTAVPATPIDGVKLVIVGAATDATVNVVALVVDPPGAVTPIVPVVAPLGTVTTNWVAVALEMVAVVPLNVTVSWAMVDENPVPKILTCVPTGPLPGVNDTIETWLDAWRAMESTFPTAS
jgi:hypothetical protein